MKSKVEWLRLDARIRIHWGENVILLEVFIIEMKIMNMMGFNRNFPQNE